MIQVVRSAKPVNFAAGAFVFLSDSRMSEEHTRPSRSTGAELAAFKAAIVDDDAMRAIRILIN